MSKNIYNFLKAVFLMVLIYSCSNPVIHKSTYQKTDYDINKFDGNWEHKTWFDSKAGMVYGFSNDSSYLNIYLKVIHTGVARKILITGLTFFIKPDEKGRKEFKVVFPFPEDLMQAQKQRMRGKVIPDPQRFNKRMDFSKQKNATNDYFRSGRAQIKVFGSIDKDKPVVRFNKSKDGVSGMIILDSLQYLHYGLKVPLSEVFTDPQLYLNDTTRFFSFGFETGSVKAPPMQRPGMGMRGMRSGGGGRGGGMGPPGNRAGAVRNHGNISMEELQVMYTPTEIKIKKAVLENSVRNTSK